MRMWEKSSELAGFEASREGNLDPTAPAETSPLQPLTTETRGADPGLQQPLLQPKAWDCLLHSLQLTNKLCHYLIPPTPPIDDQKARGALEALQALIDLKLYKLSQI
jgi:hypothetical protein